MTPDEMRRAAECLLDHADGDGDVGECLALAGKLRALAEATGWQPIETAPQQDDYSFLVRRQWRTGFTYVMQVSRSDGRMFPDHLDSDVDADDEVRDASHWQPLPPPPEAK